MVRFRVEAEPRVTFPKGRVEAGDVPMTGPAAAAAGRNARTTAEASVPSRLFMTRSSGGGRADRRRNDTPQPPDFRRNSRPCRGGGEARTGAIRLWYVPADDRAPPPPSAHRHR